MVKATTECLRAVMSTKTATAVLYKLKEYAVATDWLLYREPFKVRLPHYLYRIIHEVLMHFVSVIISFECA